MKKKRYARRMLIAFGAWSMAFAQAAAFPASSIMMVAAAEFAVPEGAEKIGTWGTADYYLDHSDGTLYFGPGKTGSSPKKLYLANYVRRIVSSPDFDTSELTSLNSLFENYSQLTDISGLASWDVGKVTNMYGVFSNTKITSLDALKDWNTENVTSINSMFYGCAQLSDLSGLENWKTGKLTNMNGAFQECTSLTTLKGLENWDVSSLQEMSGTFQNDPLTSIEALRNWKTTSLNNTCATFDGAQFSDVSPLGGWDMSQNTGPAGMLANNPNLRSLQGLENWDLTNCWSFGGIFTGSDQLADVCAIASWKTSPSKFKNLTGFLDVPAVEKVDLSQWDLSSANVNNQAPSIFSFRPIAIKLSSSYLSTKDENKTALIDGNGIAHGLSGAAASLDEYMSADLAHGPMNSTDLLAGWQDEWNGWWGLAVDVTLDDGQGQTMTRKMPMLCDVTVPMDVFERPGYLLSGWQDASGTVYDADHLYSVTKEQNQQLRALWQESDQARTIVSFDANGASGSMDPITVFGKQNLPENTFERTKYEFTGWNTAANGSGTSYDSQGEIDVLEGQKQLTLYAQWRYLPSTTTVFFDANGGSGAMEAISVKEGTSHVLSQNAFVREGWTFRGWNTKADGSGTGYQPGDTYTAEETDPSLTLYAQWEKDLDYRVLQAACSYASNLQMDEFLADGQSDVQTALAYGRMTLTRASSQQEIDQAARRLNESLLKLRRIADSAALKDLEV